MRVRPDSRVKEGTISVDCETRDEKGLVLSGSLVATIQGQTGARPAIWNMRIVCQTHPAQQAATRSWRIRLECGSINSELDLFTDEFSRVGEERGDRLKLRSAEPPSDAFRRHARLAIRVSQRRGNISQPEIRKDLPLSRQIDLLPGRDFDQPSSEFDTSDGSSALLNRSTSESSHDAGGHTELLQHACSGQSCFRGDTRPSSTHLRSRSNIMLPLQLSTAAAYRSLGEEMRSTRRCFLPGPGSLKMTNALSRLSKFCGVAWMGTFGSRCVTSVRVVSGVALLAGVVGLTQDVGDDAQVGQSEIQVSEDIDV